VSPILGIIASSASPNVFSTSYESIATTTVGVGGASTITFSSIPSTYQHLQIRATYNFPANANLRMQLNGATNNTGLHYIYGDGSSVFAGRDTAGNIISLAVGVSASTFYVQTLDLLDYANTNKNKVCRHLGGVDLNGSGAVYLASSLYETTSAVSSISITSNNGTNFSQYSSFALYGIKG
jgi:hypothetical protein